MKYTVFILLSYSGLLSAFEFAGENVLVEEVLPLFNVHEKKMYISTEDKVINPAPITIPGDAKLGPVDKFLNIEGFMGETLFKDILVKTKQRKLDVNIKVRDININGIKITPRIVTNWYQAGVSTTLKKRGGYLTYELLLSDDSDVEIKDRWVKSKNGGWIYEPPDIKLSDELTTSIGPNTHKRILLKVSLDDDVQPGLYKTDLEVTSYRDKEKFSLTIPISINVKPVKLSDSVQEKYKLLTYTAFKLNDKTERNRAYVNAMRLPGSNDEKESVLQAYYDDIASHGYNGITIRDWSERYLDKTLDLAKNAGLGHVVLHATTPINRNKKSNGAGIVSSITKRIYDKHNIELYLYGYDEPGGNKSLRQQLKLNKKIHHIGGKSVNAIFWDDMDSVVESTSENSECFDIIAYSMGSHGNKKMFNSLPYNNRDDFCTKTDTEFLTYWHPQVENPVMNRIFSGFWLWASGFDGVIPHGYYFPSHIEKFLSKQDLSVGVSNVTSPYDDWSRWMPGKLQFRHHNSVYPSKAGPIGTLQWEGVLSGVMDLKYILTLEEKLDDPNIDKDYKAKITVLLDKIRNDVLQITSPYMGDKQSLVHLKKLEIWKKEISSLLLN